MMYRLDSQWDVIYPAYVRLVCSACRPTSTARRQAHPLYSRGILSFIDIGDCEDPCRYSMSAELEYHIEKGDSRHRDGYISSRRLELTTLLQVGHQHRREVAEGYGFRGT